MAFDSAAAAAPALPPQRDPGRPYRICVVCLGNICRSPMAEYVVRAEADKAGLTGKVELDSAGTGDWHLGEPMNPGARTELSRRGYDGSAHRARQIEPAWLPDYDLVLAMDLNNLANLRRMAAGDEDLLSRMALLRSFDPQAPPAAEVPDPYGGSDELFAWSFDLIEAAARGLAEQLAAGL